MTNIDNHTHTKQTNKHTGWKHYHLAIAGDNIAGDNNWWPRVINWSPPHNNLWSPVIIWWSLVINWRPPHNNWWPRVINQWPPYNSWWPPVIMWWPRDNTWRIDSENFSPMSPGSFRNDVIWTFSLFVIFMMGLSVLIWSVDNADYFRWSNMEHSFSYHVAHVWVPKE